MGLIKTVMMGTAISLVAWNASGFAMGKGHKHPDDSRLIGKKSIYFGLDPLTPQLAHDSWQSVKTLPFDGYAMAICPDNVPCGIELPVFGSTPISSSQYQGTLSKLAGIFPQSDREIFIPVGLNNSGLTWWDDSAWATLGNNFEAISGVASRIGAKGFFFDPEDYGGFSLYSYANQSGRDAKATGGAPKSFDEYRVQAYHRGQDLMNRIQSQLADAQLLSFWGYAAALHRGHQVWDTETARKNKYWNDWALHYQLLPAFLDGMASVMKGSARLIDGYEKSYNYNHKQDFERGRNEQLQRSPSLSLLSSAEFHTRVQVGFGLALDYGDSFGNPWGKRNFWTPESFKGALRSAYDNSDRYVWIWSESAHLFNQTLLGGQPMKANVPQSYLDAILKAKSYSH